MNDVLKVYDVELVADGPVYIGSGREIGKKEYVFSKKKKQVMILEPYRLCKLLKEKRLMSAYEKFMLGTSRDDVGKWLLANKVLEKEYMQCIKYSLECGDAVVDSRSKLSIMEFVKDSYGMPYIPGSSIKGMLRTILLAYDIAKNPGKYSDTKNAVKREIRGKGGRKIYHREAKMMEASYYNILDRPETAKNDAVNDFMSGVIISDSVPLSVDDLILCQRTELHTNGTEKRINVLREALRPGTVIKFTLTIDSSKCSIDKEYIEKAIAYFGTMYKKCFLEKYGFSGLLKNNAVWLGGGTGFATKTEMYPLLGKEQGTEIIPKIFKELGVPDKHKHYKDKSFGVSPHICKITYYNGKRYQMGLCCIKIEEK